MLFVRVKFGTAAATLNVINAAAVQFALLVATMEYTVFTAGVTTIDDVDAPVLHE